MCALQLETLCGESPEPTAFLQKSVTTLLLFSVPPTPPHQWSPGESPGCMQMLGDSQSFLKLWCVGVFWG